MYYGAAGHDLIGEDFRSSPHVPLGELATAAVAVEAHDEDIRELTVDRGPIVGQVAGPAVGDAGVAVDGEDLVVGLPRPGLVGIGQPCRDDRSAPHDSLVERVE